MPIPRIALATDFSDASRPALRRAAQLAGSHGGEVVLLHVQDPGRDGAGGGAHARAIAAEERNATDLLFHAAREELERAGARVIELRLEGIPHEIILQTVRAERCDLVLLGSHGRTGLSRMLLGSVAEQVARQCEAPVLIARGPAVHDFERILVATDLDERGERAAAAACDLAAPGTVVDIIHFISVASIVSVPGRVHASTDLPWLQADARRRGAELAKRLGRPGVEPRFAMELGEPRGGVLRRIDERQHDLVAVGSHGRGGLSRVVLGSVSEGILRHAPCSVLVVR